MIHETDTIYRVSAASFPQTKKNIYLFSLGLIFQQLSINNMTSNITSVTCRWWQISSLIMLKKMSENVRTWEKKFYHIKV